MAKNKLEEKVNKLASSEVDTFIRRNENKKTTGRNVRPVIESWVDKLDNIASSTDREEADPKDFQRIHKASETLRNILKSKDDELTYFIINAPKKFWGTLRYIFEDTFTPRTYDPQPLTKYEIPGYAPQRMGNKPSPKKEEPVSNIPDKKKPTTIRVPKNTEPSYDPNKLRQSWGQSKEEGIPFSYDWLEKVNPKEHAEQIEEEVPVDIELKRKEDAGLSQDDFIEVWHRIAMCADHILKQEIAILDDLEDSSVQTTLPKVIDFAKSMIDKIRSATLVDLASLNEAIRVPFGMIEASRGMVTKLAPPSSRTVYTREMDKNVEIVTSSFMNIVEFDFDSITKFNINGKIVPLLNDVTNLIDAGVELVKEDLNQKQYYADRIQKIEDIKKQYEVAANTGSDHNIRESDKISDLFHNPKTTLIPDKMSNDQIIDRIQGYLKATMKSMAYNRTRLLVNAIKRLNSYVRQD